MKRLINILIIGLFVLGFLLVFIFHVPMLCLIKQGIGIYCPTCGVTRSFYSIFNLDFISAIKYNILGIPLFIFFALSFVTILKDIILNEDKFLSNMNKILQNKFVITILFLLIILSIIVNNITKL